MAQSSAFDLPAKSPGIELAWFFSSSEKRHIFGVDFVAVGWVCVELPHEVQGKIQSVFLSVVKAHVRAFEHAQDFAVIHAAASAHAVDESPQPRLAKKEVYVGNVFGRHPLVAVVEML